jgi:hypothetical protein
MILVHLCNILHKRDTHIFFHFKYSIELLTASIWLRYKWAYFETIEGRADVIVMFIHLIIVKVKCLKFSEIS